MESGRLAVVWQAIPGLEPEAGVQTALQWSRQECPWLVLVGHNPHLTMLAHRLLTGETGPLFFQLKKASALLLQRDTVDSTWQIEWLITPKLYRVGG